VNKTDNSSKSAERSLQLDKIYARPLWDEHDLAVIFDVKVDTVRDMKQRAEIPGIVQINQRAWRVSRDAFLELMKLKGMPQPKRGRPLGSD